MVQKSSDHQLRLVVYPIIYRVFAPSQVVVWDFFHQHEHPKVFHKKLLVFLVSIPKKGINFFSGDESGWISGSHFQGSYLEFPLTHKVAHWRAVVSPPVQGISSFPHKERNMATGSMMGKPRRFHWANGAAKLAPGYLGPHPFGDLISHTPTHKYDLSMMFTSFQTRNSFKKNSSFHIPSTYTTPLQHCV